MSGTQVCWNEKLVSLIKNTWNRMLRNLCRSKFVERIFRGHPKEMQIFVFSEFIKTINLFFYVAAKLLCRQLSVQNKNEQMTLRRNLSVLHIFAFDFILSKFVFFPSFGRWCHRRDLQHKRSTISSIIFDAKLPRDEWNVRFYICWCRMVSCITSKLKIVAKPTLLVCMNVFGWCGLRCLNVQWT